MTTTKLPTMQLPATTLADHLALMIHEIRWHQEHTGLTLQGLAEQNVQQATNALLAAQDATPSQPEN